MTDEAEEDLTLEERRMLELMEQVTRAVGRLLLGHRPGVVQYVLASVAAELLSEAVHISREHPTEPAENERAVRSLFDTMCRRWQEPGAPRLGSVG